MTLKRPAPEQSDMPLPPRTRRRFTPNLVSEVLNPQGPPHESRVADDEDVNGATTKQRDTQNIIRLKPTSTSLLGPCDSRGPA